MRSIEEIDADVAVALALQDTAALEALANELDGHEHALHEARIINLRATVCRFRGQYQESISLNMKALRIHEETGNIKRIAITLGNVSNAYDDYGDHVKSLEYKQRALDIMLQHGMMIDAARVYVTLGTTHREMGNNESALDSLNRGLTIYETAKDIVGIAGVATAAGNIANLFQSVGDQSTALEYYFRSLELYEEVGSIAECGRTTGNIGHVYADIGDAETAIEKMQFALDTARKLGDDRLQIHWLEAIGVVRWQQSQYKEAISCFHAALSLYEQLEHLQAPVNLLVNIVKATIDAGDVDEARRLLSTINADSIKVPHTRTFYLITRAELQMLDQDLEGAKLSLEEGRSIALRTTSKKNELQALKGLRDLALQQRDLDAYVRFNEEHQKLVKEMQTGDSGRRLALHEQKRALDVERHQRERERAILHSTLPQHIADRVVRGETVNDHYDNAAVIFLDIVGFTAISEIISSEHVVKLLDQFFTTLDNVCEHHNVMKIKTIGDSYMAVAFSEQPNSLVSEQPISSPAERAASAALDMLDAVSHIVVPTSSPLQVRIGLHSGPVTAGVIGTQRMQFDVWGDTVNVASRLEGTAAPGRIHISEAFAMALTPLDLDKGGAEAAGVTYRGEVEIKGKGVMSTYWLERT